MGSPNWLLVETLNPSEPAVIAVGGVAKRRILLGCFVRPSDRALAVAAVRRVCRTGLPVAEQAGGKVVQVDPISDDDTGSVHAVWLRIGYSRSEVPSRPSAWAFVWDLESGTAKRSRIVSSDESWFSLGIDQCRSVADGMSRLDLGQSTTAVLAGLVSGTAGSVLQVEGVEMRPCSSWRKIQVVADIRPPAEVSDGRTPLVRGVSLDMGLAATDDLACDPPKSLDELVAHATAKPYEYRAVLDPTSLTLLSWHGVVPDRLAWRQVGHSAVEPIFHPDDLPVVRELAARARHAGHSLLDEHVNVRLLSQSGGYMPVRVSATSIDLGGDARPLLCAMQSSSPL